MKPGEAPLPVLPMAGAEHTPFSVASIMTIATYTCEDVPILILLFSHLKYADLREAVNKLLKDP
jgi:hypothetical protein